MIDFVGLSSLRLRAEPHMRAWYLANCEFRSKKKFRIYKGNLLSSASPCPRFLGCEWAGAVFVPLLTPIPFAVAQSKFLFRSANLEFRPRRVLFFPHFLSRILDFFLLGAALWLSHELWPAWFLVTCVRKVLKHKYGRMLFVDYFMISLYYGTCKTWRTCT